MIAFFKLLAASALVMALVLAFISIRLLIGRKSKVNITSCNAAENIGGSCSCGAGACDEKTAS